MKKIYIILSISLVGLSHIEPLLSIQPTQKKSNNQTNSKDRNTSKMGANPYTYAPQLFTAEDKSTGFFWAGNNTKKYPGKAFLDEIEYINVIAIPESQLQTKKAKKDRKNRKYLGSYIDIQTKKVMYVYGIKKTADKVDQSPDADVITQIAIKEDYGPGE